MRVLALETSDGDFNLLKDKLKDYRDIEIVRLKFFEEFKNYSDFKSINIILSDISVKGDDALDASEIIKFKVSNPVIKDIPIIVYSHTYDEEEYFKFRNAGFNYFLDKKSPSLTFLNAFHYLVNNGSYKENLEKKDFLFVRKRNRIYKLNYSEIEKVEVDGKYVAIFGEDQKYLLRSSLNEFLEKLKGALTKVSQSCAINMDKVISFNPADNEILLENFSAYCSRAFRVVFTKDDI